MLNKKYFIFEAFRIKHCVAREASYNSLNVLKEIESPGRVKLCIGFAAYRVCAIYILPGLFLHHQEYTSIYPIVGSGNYYHQQTFTDMFKTSVRNRTTTANDMTAGNRLFEAIASFISLMGDIGGDNFTASLLSFTQFWLVIK